MTETRTSDIIGDVPDDPDAHDAIEELEEAYRKTQDYLWSGSYDDATAAHVAAMQASLALESVVEKTKEDR